MNNKTFLQMAAAVSAMTTIICIFADHGLAAFGGIVATLAIIMISCDYHE